MQAKKFVGEYPREGVVGQLTNFVVTVWEVLDNQKMMVDIVEPDIIIRMEGGSHGPFPLFIGLMLFLFFKLLAMLLNFFLERCDHVLIVRGEVW